MQTGPSDAERMQLEAGFRARRRRVLRAQAGVAVCALLGLGLVIVAKQAAPGAFEGAVACFAIATFASLGVAWQTARRHWRCPACEERWASQDVLASFAWNHCARCGAPLLAHPVQRERERLASLQFAMQAPSHEELLSRFERRRRSALIAAGLVVLAGLAALVQVQARAPAEWVENAVVAGFGGVVAGILVWGGRCPRCRSGIVGRGRSCQRCGLRLDPDGGSGDGLDSRSAS
jgi:hypothetical protein